MGPSGFREQVNGLGFLSVVRKIQNWFSFGSRSPMGSLGKSPCQSGMSLTACEQLVSTSFPMVWPFDDAIFKLIWWPMKSQTSALNSPISSLEKILGKWFAWGRSWLKSLPMMLLVLPAIFVPVCGTSKVIISCLSHCVSPAYIRITMSKWLVSTNHVYISL